jgi:quercetin dioxygenase-like cupin family protein
MVVSIYGDETDMSVVVWNLEPGQENPLHSHPGNAHTLYVLEGQGIYTRGGAPAEPIRAGQCIIVPRSVVHGVRNTGSTRLSYLAVTSLNAGEGYVRDSQAGASDPRRGPGAGHEKPPASFTAFFLPRQREWSP